MTTPNTPPGGAMTTTPAAGQVARQDFGGTELAVSGETAAAAAAAQATAIVQARYVMAMRNPRDWDNVRVRIMREVERPGFAEIAWYRKPIGKGVEGLSVRFAEAAARCMGNLSIEPEITFDDAAKRIVRVTATDLETNYNPSLPVVIEKTVERSSLADGRIAISVRKNSEGKLTYTVPATEDEMLGKQNSITSKARRSLILQILPGDIADAAKARILEIRRGAVAKDPESFRKKVVDSFALLNVMPSDLKLYLGHDVATCSPAELEALRDLYSTIAAGEGTWAEALAEKVGGEAAAAAGPKKSGLDGVTDELERKKAAAAAAAQAPACEHPQVKPSDVAGGKTVTCPDCKAEVRDPDAPPTSKPRQGRLG
jgi:hypothetical protein